MSLDRVLPDSANPNNVYVNITLDQLAILKRIEADPKALKLKGTFIRLSPDDALRQSLTHYRDIFWSKVDIGDPDHCWRWKGLITNKARRQEHDPYRQPMFQFRQLGLKPSNLGTNQGVNASVPPMIMSAKRAAWILTVPLHLQEAESLANNRVFHLSKIRDPKTNLYRFSVAAYDVSEQIALCVNPYHLVLKASGGKKWVGAIEESEANLRFWTDYLLDFEPTTKLVVSRTDRG